MKAQLKEVEEFLVISCKKVEDFLNTTVLDQLNQDKKEDLYYYQAILSSLRRLLVYSEECLEACKVILHDDPFQKGAAEKTLYRIYHQCIVEFFSPKNDAWFEDSRSAYTGRNSIKFYKVVPESLSHLINELEGDFQKMREDLEFYETDYRTKITQSK